MSRDLVTQKTKVAGSYHKKGPAGETNQPETLPCTVWDTNTVHTYSDISPYLRFQDCLHKHTSAHLISNENNPMLKPSPKSGTPSHGTSLG